MKELAVKPSQIGNRIRLARKKKNLSQEQLAEQISRDQRSVSEYESGKRQIYAHEIPTIAKALDVPIMYFFVDVASESEIEEVIAIIVATLPSNKQRFALEILKELEKL